MFSLPIDSGAISDEHLPAKAGWSSRQTEGTLTLSTQSPTTHLFPDVSDHYDYGINDMIYLRMRQPLSSCQTFATAFPSLARHRSTRSRRLER